jgi:hypothetical protein
VAINQKTQINDLNAIWAIKLSTSIKPYQQGKKIALIASWRFLSVSTIPNLPAFMQAAFQMVK